MVLYIQEHLQQSGRITEQRMNHLRGVNDGVHNSQNGEKGYKRSSGSG